MCGIVGSINLASVGYSVTASKIMHSMLLASTQRGVDGTGLVVGDLDVSAAAAYYSEPVAAQDFCTKTDMERMLKDARWLIGHTRAATIGGVSAEATHPFSVEDVIGVHNGTISTMDTLFPEYKDGVNDSHMVFMALAGVAPEKATDILKELDDGAYALVWYDARIKALRFARNDQRPLWFHKTDRTWWYASEPGNIAASIARHDLAPLSYAKIVPWQLKTYTLMTIPLDGTAASAEQYTPTVTGWPRYTRGGYAGTSYATPWNNYERDGYDPWDDDVNSIVTDGRIGSGQRATPATTPDGWVTVDSGDALYETDSWFGEYRFDVRTDLEALCKTVLPRTKDKFKEVLIALARRSGTTDDVPTVQFVAQAITKETGMIYGALTLDYDGVVMPVVGMLSKEQLEEYNKRVSTAKPGYYPIYQAEITSLKVYASGEIGVGIDGASLMGWAPEKSMTKEERAIGSHTTHPHLSDNKSWAAWGYDPTLGGRLSAS